MNAVVLCSVAEVKAIVTPKTVTDAEITSIVAHASNLIALDTGASSDASDNTTLNMACIHSSAAFVLQKMKYSGELANSVQYGTSNQSNNVTAEIKMHQDLASRYIETYKYSVSAPFSIIYGRVGPGTVNEGYDE